MKNLWPHMILQKRRDELSPYRKILQKLVVEYKENDIKLKDLPVLQQAEVGT